MVNFGLFDSFDDEIAYYEKRNKRRSTSKRTVKYMSAGHTRVTYAHRTLDINFKESPKEFAAKKKRIAKEKARKYRKAHPKQISERRQRNVRESYDTIQRHKDLKSDKYSIEDMRAQLRDDRWEEVCGHKRWNYDSNSTIKEYKKYLKHKNRN